MNGFLWFCIIVATLGGLLFGYHTAVIAGAMLFIKQEFQLTPESQGFVVSIILLGALLGSIVAGILADRLGRKSVLFSGAIAIVVGSWFAVSAPTINHVLIGRFIAGIGIGIFSVVTPMFLGEISPKAHRGTIISLYQLAITLGILAAYGVNLWLAKDANWRAMLAWGIVPAILQLLCFPFLSESPHWLMGRGNSQKARRLCEKLGQRLEAAPVSRNEQKGWKALFAPGLRLALFVGLALSCFQQITGINAIIYYAPQIFEMVGLNSANVALFATFGMGILNVLTTLVAVWLLDRLGRKSLLLIGMFGMAAALGCISLGFITQLITLDGLSVVALMAYVGFFSISLGPVTWVVISEIYPIAIRGRAMGIATLANWLCNYFVALFFLDLVQALGSGGAFALFTGITLVAILFVYKLLPETKGKTFEEIQRLFLNKSLIISSLLLIYHKSLSIKYLYC